MLTVRLSSSWHGLRRYRITSTCYDEESWNISTFQCNLKWPTWTWVLDESFLLPILNAHFILNSVLVLSFNAINGRGELDAHNFN